MLPAKRTYYFVILLLFPFTLSAQWNSLAAVQHSADSLLRNASGLYNGSEYEPHDVIFTDGHPFFQQAGFQEGSIAYDGHYYQGTDLMLDLVRDELILLHYNGYSRISMVKEKVDSFSINDMAFINIKPGTSIRGLSPGYYMILYKGKSMLLEKLSKSMQVYYRGTSSGVEVFNNVEYFLVSGDYAQNVKRKKSFLNQLSKKEAVVQTLRKNRIYYKDSPILFMQQALIIEEKKQ